MNTHSRQTLWVVTLTLGLSLILSTDAPVSGAASAPVGPGLCASLPERMPLSGSASQEWTGPVPTIGHMPAVKVSGLIGALGQMIVESELSRAAVSGRFQPVIHASVAGTDFALEVCRDTIAGEVSMAGHPALRFVIGDFDGDGITDVAIRRHGSQAWAVDLGALRLIAVRLVAPARVHWI